MGGVLSPVGSSSMGLFHLTGVVSGLCGSASVCSRVTVFSGVALGISELNVDSTVLLFGNGMVMFSSVSVVVSCASVDLKQGPRARNRTIYPKQAS